MPNLRTVRAILLLTAFAATLGVLPAGRAAGRVGPERVSVTNGGAQANGFSGECAVSANGAIVAFDSDASDLVQGDGNGNNDVFVRDRKAGGTTLVSVATGGAPGDQGGRLVGLSANGRIVAFASTSTNLVAGDTNNANDVFVHDRATGETRRVSVASDGTEANGGSFTARGGLSANGRVVTFHSSATNLVAGDTNGQEDVFVHDLKTGATILASVAEGGGFPNGRSAEATVSSNGRFVAFSSSASNLEPGFQNGRDQVFVRDLRKRTTIRASVDSAGNPSSGFLASQPVVSANGKVVAFHSDATNLVQGDSNAADDVFVHDFRTGRTRRASVASDGAEASGGGSTNPAISSNGKTVAFYSNATNLVQGDTNSRSDVFVFDLKKGAIRRVTVDAQGQEANARSFSGAASLSSNGKFVVFYSDATNLATGDTNGVSDVFLVSTK